MSARAEKYAEVHSISDVHMLLKTGFEPLHILGGGSNVLLTEDLKGLVIKNEIKGIYKMAETSDEVIIAIGGGESWHGLVMWAVENGLGGIENLSLIPGSVGAAPIQNIGAYGVELKDIFHQLEAIELDTGRMQIFNSNECQFGYRDSIFKNELKGRYFITKVILRLSKIHQLNTSYGAVSEILMDSNIENPTIRDVSNAVIKIRQIKLPDPAEIGNSGSFFKNPEIEITHFQQLRSLFPNIVFYEISSGKIKIPAGWLIETAGWKGKRVGDVGTHEKQALVLINHGNATGIDILNLANRIQYDVIEKFGISLMPEVNIW